MNRPDDQTWWQRVWRRPSPAQRGWDAAHAFIRENPTPVAFNRTMNAHAACLCFDPGAFDHTFGAVIDFYLENGVLPEDAPPVTVVTLMLPPPHAKDTEFQRTAGDCSFCARPGETCVDLDRCPHFHGKTIR